MSPESIYFSICTPYFSGHEEPPPQCQWMLAPPSSAAAVNAPAIVEIVSGCGNRHRALRRRVFIFRFIEKLYDDSPNVKCIYSDSGWRLKQLNWLISNCCNIHNNGMSHRIRIELLRFVELSIRCQSCFLGLRRFLEIGIVDCHNKKSRKNENISSSIHNRKIHKQRN